LANIYLSVLDRHFMRIEHRDMSPSWRRQHRRRKGLPNYRLVRFADDFVVLVHGTKSDADTLRAQIGEVLTRQLKMTLSVEKTHTTTSTTVSYSWAFASSAGDEETDVGWC
jgi:RNA-directed DNA polymerase